MPSSIHSGSNQPKPNQPKPNHAKLNQSKHKQDHLNPQSSAVDASIVQSFYQVQIKRLNQVVDLIGYSLFLLLAALVTFKFFWYCFGQVIWPVLGAPVLDWVLAWESVWLRMLVGLPLILVAISPFLILYYFLFAHGAENDDETHYPWWFGLVKLRETQLFKVVRGMFYISGVFATLKLVWLLDNSEQENWPALLWEFLSRF